MTGAIPWSTEELEAVRASPTYEAYRERGFARSWHAFRHKRRELGLPPVAIASRRQIEQPPNEPLDWREVNRLLGQFKTLRSAVKRSTHFASIDIPTDRPFPVICIGDTHIGAWSSDHELLEEITDQILYQPDLRIILLGDLANMAINLRGVAEVQDDVLPAELQEEYLAAWLDELSPRVIAACWGNHDVERQERFSGYSGVARLLGERSVYTSGIGHLDLLVGSVEYRLAISHRFPGRSRANPCAGPMNYLRDHPSRDIAIAGDSHVPGLSHFTIEGRDKLAIQAGSTQTASGYARRYFSLFTDTRYPVLVLDPEEYAPRAYYDLADWLAAEGKR